MPERSEADISFLSSPWSGSRIHGKEREDVGPTCPWVDFQTSQPKDRWALRFAQDLFFHVFFCLGLSRLVSALIEARGHQPQVWLQLNRTHKKKSRSEAEGRPSADGFSCFVRVFQTLGFLGYLRPKAGFHGSEEPRSQEKFDRSEARYHRPKAGTSLLPRAAFRAKHSSWKLEAIDIFS